MQKDLSIRVFWVAAALLLVTPLLVRFEVVVNTPVANLGHVVDFIYDDGYYYLCVAANLVDAGRSTFDGITATNGYQPLWLMVLAALARLTGTAPHTLFIAGCALIYALACVGPLMALLWWRSAVRPIALCLGAGLAIVIVQQPMAFIQGLEPILFVPIVLPFIMTIERAKTDRRTLTTLSALLAIAFLVRLDSLSLFVSGIVCVPLFELASGTLHRRDLMKRLVEVALRLSTFVIPTLIVYAAINQWLFGAPVPVSGIAKLIGAPKFSNWGVFGMFFSRWKSVGFLIALLLPLEIITRRFLHRASTLFYRSFSMIFLALLIQTFYYAAFSAWGIWPWYTYLGAIDTVVLVARIIYLSSLCFSGFRPGLIAAAAMLIVGIWAADRSVALVLDSLSPESRVQLGFLSKLGVPIAKPSADITSNELSLLMLGDFFPPAPRTLIAMGDRAGGLAFWGRERVSIVQTEGLLLDVGYFKARATNKGAEYLERFPIKYMVVDREVFATVEGPDHRLEYVIPDPIQGRINIAPVPTFCFPPEAIRYRKTYSTFLGVNMRIAFLFADRQPCSSAAMALVRSIETGIGLRQYSLPGEYLAGAAGADKRSEDRDRRRSFW